MLSNQPPSVKQVFAFYIRTLIKSAKATAARPPRRETRYCSHGCPARAGSARICGAIL